MKRTLLILAVLLTSICCVAQDDCRHSIRFTWGGSFAGSVDMSGHDMSSIGLDAYVGMSTVGINVLGVGSAMSVNVSNSSRILPVYAIVRSNFSSRPSLCFCDIRGGIAINYLEFDVNQVGGYFSGGVGINLASGSRFSSHLILGYTFVSRNEYTVGAERLHPGNLHMATARLGITF